MTLHRRSRVLLLISILTILAGSQRPISVCANPALSVRQFEDDVESRIVNRTKKLSKGSIGRKTVVRFNVRKDGSIQKLWVLEKSDSPKHDLLALETVKACAPFKPIPAGGPAVEEFKVDINCNDHTWESSFEPCSDQPDLDPFLRRLTQYWQPVAQKECDSFSVKFDVDSNGAIGNASFPQLPLSQIWKNGLAQFISDQCFLAKISSAVIFRQAPAFRGSSFIFPTSRDHTQAQHSTI